MISFGIKTKIKRVTSKYLFKYKSLLYDYIEEIKEKGKLENFLKQSINSQFSEEISELINFKDLNIKKEFESYINNQFNNLIFISSILPLITNLPLFIAVNLIFPIYVLAYSIFSIKNLFSKKIKIN